MLLCVQKMRQSHSETTLQGSRHAQPPAARPSDGDAGAAPPAARGPLEAGHASFFAPDREESGSGSDDDQAASTAARRAKRAQQTRRFPRPPEAPLPAPSRPGQPQQQQQHQHQQEALPAAVPSSNGTASAAGPAGAAEGAAHLSDEPPPPASYYMPVVDRPSLLDMALSWEAATPPASSELRPSHSLLDIEWAVSTPRARAGSPAAPLVQGLHAHSPAVVTADERAVASAAPPAAAAAQDERPRNGWAGLGEAVSAGLADTSSSLLAETGSSALSAAGSAALSLPPALQQLPSRQVSRAASSAGSLARPIGSPADPLAALDPFAGLGSWSSMTSAGSPGRLLVSLGARGSYSACA